MATKTRVFGPQQETFLTPFLYDVKDAEGERLESRPADIDRFKGAKVGHH